MDVLNSIGKWFKERTTSPLYGTYIFSVILVNWKFFYILFWQSEEKLSLPKIEYVQSTILDSQTGLEHILFFIIIPAIITYFAIWWLPILANFAHAQHLNFFFERKSFFNIKRLEYENREKSTLDQISEIKVAQAETEATIQEFTSQEDRWSTEFELTKDQKLFELLNKIKDLVYNNSGITRKWDNNISRFVLLIDSDILASADAKGLVRITGEESKERVEWTDKGKYFLSKYMSDSNMI